MTSHILTDRDTIARVVERAERWHDQRGEGRKAPTPAISPRQSDARASRVFSPGVAR